MICGDGAYMDSCSSPLFQVAGLCQLTAGTFGTPRLHLARLGLSLPISGWAHHLDPFVCCGPATKINICCTYDDTPYVGRELPAQHSVVDAYSVATPSWEGCKMRQPLRPQPLFFLLGRGHEVVPHSQMVD